MLKNNCTALSLPKPSPSFFPPSKSFPSLYLTLVLMTSYWWLVNLCTKCYCFWFPLTTKYTDSTGLAPFGKSKQNLALLAVSLNQFHFENCAALSPENRFISRSICFYAKYILQQHQNCCHLKYLFLFCIHSLVFVSTLCLMIFFSYKKYCLKCQTLERRSRVSGGTEGRRRKGQYHLITPQLWHLFSFSFSILFFPLLHEIATPLEKLHDLFLFPLQGRN